MGRKRLDSQNVKPVGDRVFKMRIGYGPIYHLYHALRCSKLALLLIGEDKSSQQRDITKVKKSHQEHE
jgi:Uncharacterized protein conserved in bacteria